jgi:hypothetical protein
MAWKTIQGRRYLYKTVRVGGKVKSVYVGCGAAAELVALEVERGKVERAANRKSVQDAKMAIDTLQQMAEEAIDEFQLLMRAVFIAGGLYLHRRCEWRSRRFVNVRK